MTLALTPTWVYFADDVDGRTLYVGITRYLSSRLRQHRRSKTWWPQVYVVHAALYPNRGEASAWEALHIPGAVHNVDQPRQRTLPAVAHPLITALDTVQLIAGEDC